MSKELRKQIIEGAKDRLTHVADDFRERVNELKSVTIGDDKGDMASQTESRRDADLEMLDTYVGQLDFVEEELQILSRIDPDQGHEKVEFGAVVICDKRNFLISIGIEDFTVGNKTYMGLSTQAPLYKNMSGCQVGDKVVFHGMEYQIEEIF